MEKLQREIMELNYKVNRLSQIVERITREMNLPYERNQLEINMAFEDENTTPSNDYSLDENMMSQLSDNQMENPSYVDTPIMIAHKDILDDDNHHQSEQYHNSLSQSESELSCDLQVQRLTAQLTAAYHRIAALEEQLLLKRNVEITNYES